MQVGEDLGCGACEAAVGGLVHGATPASLVEGVDLEVVVGGEGVEEAVVGGAVVAEEVLVSGLRLVTST